MKASSGGPTCTLAAYQPYGRPAQVPVADGPVVALVCQRTAGSAVAVKATTLGTVGLAAHGEPRSRVAAAGGAAGAAIAVSGTNAVLAVPRA